MLGGGRFKKKKKNNPKTTNLQLWRQNGNGMWTGRRMIVFNKKKKKRDWIFLYKHKGQFVKERERHTLLEGNFGFLLFKLAKQMELAQYHAADPFLIFFFLFFSFFVLWAGSLASKDNFPWTPCANCAVFLLESVYKTK